MNRKAQSTLEYAVIITVVLAGLLAMQKYINRGIQGKLRSSADNIGEQYSAGNVTSTYTTEQIGSMVTKEKFGKDASGNYAQGVSRFEVITPAEVDRYTTAGNEEKITTDLKSEKLFQ